MKKYVDRLWYEGAFFAFGMSSAIAIREAIDNPSFLAKVLWSVLALVMAVGSFFADKYTPRKTETK